MARDKVLFAPELIMLALQLKKQSAQWSYHQWQWKRRRQYNNESWIWSFPPGVAHTSLCRPRLRWDVLWCLQPNFPKGSRNQGRENSSWHCAHHQSRWWVWSVPKPKKRDLEQGQEKYFYVRPPRHSLQFKESDLVFWRINCLRSNGSLLWSHQEWNSGVFQMALHQQLLARNTIHLFSSKLHQNHPKIISPISLFLISVKCYLVQFIFILFSECFGGFGRQLFEWWGSNSSGETHWCSVWSQLWSGMCWWRHDRGSCSKQVFGSSCWTRQSYIRWKKFCGQTHPANQCKYHQCWANSHPA